MPNLSPKNYYRSLGPLLDRQTLSEEPNWPALFGRLAPMELEIGFGNGEALNKASMAGPETDFVGLEIVWASIKRALRRLAQPPRTNVRLVMLPARPALKLLFAPQSLKAIRAFFPVPWPRENHEGKRLFDRDFLNLAADRLKSSGLFELVTDNRILADWVMEQAKNSHLSLRATEIPAQFDTKYGRKWRDQGQDTYFHLLGGPKGQPQTLTEGLITMRPTFLASLDPLNYRPEGQTGPLTVVFEDFFFDAKRQEALLLTKVVEEKFVQRFYIRIVQLPEGRWKLFPAILGQTLPTAGAQLALELAARSS
ncbi:MAG: hypothetical protein LBT38_08325 [Deltaproteobacteria bacterium]|nr:hypothetical protein [Deltaproteobacteria bacterium]